LRNGVRGRVERHPAGAFRVLRDVHGSGESNVELDLRADRVSTRARLPHVRVAGRAGRLTPCCEHRCAVGWQPRLLRSLPMSTRRLISLAAILLVGGGVGATVVAQRSDAFATVSPPVRSAPVRVLVYHDMEGLAGQDEWQSFLFSHPEKDPARQKLLVADLNAVIDG